MPGLRCATIAPGFFLEMRSGGTMLCLREGKEPLVEVIGEDSASPPALNHAQATLANFLVKS